MSRLVASLHNCQVRATDGIPDKKKGMLSDGRPQEFVLLELIPKWFKLKKEEEFGRMILAGRQGLEPR